jgi:hypothetical protein
MFYSFSFHESGQFGNWHVKFVTERFSEATHNTYTQNL